MRVSIHPFTQGDARLMSHLVRPMDRFEFHLMSGGMPVRESLDHLARRSRRARAAYIDGRLIACYGVVSPTALSDIGNPWLVASEDVRRPEVRRAFVEHTTEQMIWLAGGFTKLWNFVHAENRIAIRWLKWIGFTFSDERYEVRGEPFLFFKMEA